MFVDGVELAVTSTGDGSLSNIIVIFIRLSMTCSYWVSIIMSLYLMDAVYMVSTIEMLAGQLLVLTYFHCHYPFIKYILSSS